MTTATATAATFAAAATMTTAGALAQIAKSAGKSSLADLMRSKRQSLLLADCSGSMDDKVAAGSHVSKIDALRDVVAGLKVTNPVPVAAFGLYGTTVDLVETLPTEGQGGTPLGAAIRFGASMGANHLLLVTDGIPDSEADAMNAARDFGGVVDVFYIADSYGTGADFAKRLAALTGGTCTVTTLENTKALSSKIAGLLGEAQ